MTDRQPSEVTNLDRYGNPALPWSRAQDLLASGPTGARTPPGSAPYGTMAIFTSPAGPELASHGTWRPIRPAPSRSGSPAWT